NGAGASDLHWRWSPTAEDRYIAQHRPAAQPTSQPLPSLTLRPGDWPGFRGPDRDAVVHNLTIDTHWDKNPPKQLWRRPIGPGWSSMSVVDGHLFTQEQRGDNEAIVCLNADTGSEIWSHPQPGRFWDALSSVGPRATPTFADGRIYAQCATGT